MKEFVVIGNKFDTEVDSKMFDKDDTLVSITDRDRTMAHLLERLGKFKSVAEAKRNGWDKPIPTGYHEFKIGKGANQMNIILWNPTTTMSEFRQLNPDIVD